MFTQLALANLPINELLLKLQPIYPQELDDIQQNALNLTFQEIAAYFNSRFKNAGLKTTSTNNLSLNGWVVLLKKFDSSIILSKSEAKFLTQKAVFKKNIISGLPHELDDIEKKYEQKRDKNNAQLDILDHFHPNIFDSNEKKAKSLLDTISTLAIDLSEFDKELCRWTKLYAEALAPEPDDYSDSSNLTPRTPRHNKVFDEELSPRLPSGDYTDWSSSSDDDAF